MNSIFKVDPKVVLVTGSTDGIGLATAALFAKKGYSVIIHGRKEEKCQQKAEELNSATDLENKVDYVVGDLSSTQEIKAFCLLLIERYQKIDVLVNNAGAYFSRRKVNHDGIENTFMINYLSRFYLIFLLYDLLNKSSGARIIDISGSTHKSGAIDFDNINLKDRYSGMKANAQAKLANVIFTLELAARLESDGSKIKANTIHPGAIKTDLILKDPNFSGLMKFLYSLSKPFLTPPEVAAKFIFALSEKEVPSGNYFEGLNAKEPSEKALDQELARKLWKFSEDSLGVQFVV